MLSGNEILKEIANGNIVIIPFNKENINPNSYNLHISNEIVVYDEEVLDSKNNNKTKTIIIPEEGLILEPNKLYLSKTIEHTETDIYVPILHGRSSSGRLGLAVHVTGDFGDVGFKGKWTLQLHCVEPIRIYPNMKLCQICYFKLIGNNDILYKGKYQNSDTVVPSRLYNEYEKNS